MNTRIFISLHLALAAGIGVTAQNAVFVKYPTPVADYEVRNIGELNSSQLDFYAIPYQDGVIFSSTRDNESIFACSQDFAKGHYSDLWFAKTDAEGNFYAPQLLEGEVNGKYHDGVATFTPDGTTMYFSRNTSAGPNAKGWIDLKVCLAVWKKGMWREVQETTFNSPDFGSCHPTLSADGKWLFFASNRPGGYGGMDVYVCRRLDNSSLGAPINLGSEVNTPGNEVFPFISADNRLYFSSDGHSGIGGLDVYAVQMDGSVAENINLLPSPVNSDKDDFGFTNHPGSNKGFLTSNRAGGKGLDDIYAWTSRSKQTNPAGKNGSLAFKGTIRDKTTDQLLPFADVKVLNKCNGEKLQFSANQYGVFEFPMDCNCDYEFVAFKGDYLYEYKTVRSADGPCNKSEPFILLYLERAPSAALVEPKAAATAKEKLEVGNVIRLDKLFYDYNESLIRSDAAVELDKVVAWMKKYPSLEIELSSHTDARGTDTYNEFLSQNRANAAMEFIVRQGISQNRITAAGYGEYRLDNRCGNGIPCTEDEHQWNRRTEIRVTKLDEPGVRLED